MRVVDASVNYTCREYRMRACKPYAVSRLFIDIGGER